MLDWVKNLMRGGESAQRSEPARTISEGNEFLRRAEWAKAADCFRSAISVDPDNVAVHINLGFALAEQRQFTPARQALRQALALDRHAVDAHFIMGTMARDEGNLAEAAENIEQALALKPDFEVGWRVLCEILLESGQAARARHVLQQAVTRLPQAAAFHATLGNLYAEAQEYGPAVQSFQAALSLQPDDPGICFSCANALVALARYGEAVACYERVVQTQPDNAQVLCNLGRALQGMNRYEEALRCYDRALVLAPDLPDALFNRGTALDGLGRLEEAVASYDRLLERQPAHVDSLCNRGYTLRRLKRLTEALDSYDRALQLDPDSADAHGNRGVVLVELNRRVEALASYDRALQLAPDSAETINNRGALLSELGRVDEALESFTSALALRPDYAEAHFNESMCRLLLGDFTTGWAKYEWRWQAEDGGKRRKFAQPLWHGRESLEGKTILLHAEQGLGDTIQFSRYAGLVADKGAKVLLEVQPALRALLSPLHGVHKVFAKGEPLPAFDYQCPLLSLPLVFNTDLASVPARGPYLEHDAGLANSWSAKLGVRTRPAVGLVWSGNAVHRNDRNRSIRFAEFVKLMTADLHFVSLQKEIRAEDKPLLADCKSIRHFGDALADFADTAALVSQMDLVISVDTSVAHLAGAMGKPVWLLLPCNPDWRWLLNRADSPWYPSMRLFRQTRSGDWSSVLLEVASELKRLQPHMQGGTAPLETQDVRLGQEHADRR